MANQCDSGTYALKPPDCVRGMKILSKDAFTKKVRIPCIEVENKQIQKHIKLWKKQQLDIRGIKSIIPLKKCDNQHSPDKMPELAIIRRNNTGKTSHSLVLLDPEKLIAHPFSEDTKKQLGIGELQDLNHYEEVLTYENWKLKDIFNEVLPKDSETVSSFTLIGHIAHLNLREHLLPYSSLIGQVILDKVPTVKTVVNKLGIIDNTYRNFQIDLLAGEENYITQVGENGCLFELDFSKVYWNSRLGEEHRRIVTATPEGSIVYDVFAGVGPFAIPLAKNKFCNVFANDLNPSSFKYLKKNVTLNKKMSGSIECFNLDGREFIRTVIKKDLAKSIHLVLTENTCKSHIQRTIQRTIVMNLPALAVDFLDAFTSLLQDLPPSIIKEKYKWKSIMPIVHCYTFVKINEELGNDVAEDTTENTAKRTEALKAPESSGKQNISVIPIVKSDSDHSTETVKKQQTPTIGMELTCSKPGELISSEKSKLKYNRTQITESMENQLRRRAKAALRSELPRDATVTWVRKVSNNKDMVRLSFSLWPELLTDSLAEAENLTDEPDAKRQKV